MLEVKEHLCVNKTSVLCDNKQTESNLEHEMCLTLGGDCRHGTATGRIAGRHGDGTGTHDVDEICVVVEHLRRCFIRTLEVDWRGEERFVSGGGVKFANQIESDWPQMGQIWVFLGSVSVQAKMY